MSQVLKYETQHNKAALGCSVFGYNDAYARLRPLLQRFQELQRSARNPADAPQLFLVSADVSQAYDSIDVAKLMDIIEPLLKSPQYLIMKHAEVMCSQLCISCRQNPAALSPAVNGRCYAEKVVSPIVQKCFMERSCAGKGVGPPPDNIRGTCKESSGLPHQSPIGCRWCQQPAAA